MPHRFSALTIALVPFVLLSLSSSYVHAEMEDVKEEFTENTEEAWQELRELDQKFLSMQEVHSLITPGTKRILSPSIAKAYLEEWVSSPFGDYASLQKHIASAEEGLRILRTRLISIGKKTIAIDLSEQEARVIENGVIVARYRVSSGASDTPTPRGEFAIHRKQELRVSAQDVPYRMPYYMAFTPSESHGLHALPYLGKSAESSDFWQEAVTHIGTPVSHGCVRFLPEDAAKIFEWAEVGTKVYISA